MTFSRNLVYLSDERVVMDKRPDKGAEVNLILIPNVFYYQAFLFHKAKVKYSFKKINKILLNFLHNKNIMRYFALSKQRTSFISFIGAAFFIATSLGYLSNGCRAEKTIIVLCKTEKVAFSFLNTLSFSFMQRTMKTASKANNSNFTSTPAGAKSGVQVTSQVVYQTVIPQVPKDIVGEKVIYNEKYLKKRLKDYVPVPECGYFTIIKAVLQDDGRVMVALYPYPRGYQTFQDGTHICVANMKKYKEL